MSTVVITDDILYIDIDKDVHRFRRGFDCSLLSNYLGHVSCVVITDQILYDDIDKAVHGLRHGFDSLVQGSEITKHSQSLTQQP